MHTSIYQHARRQKSVRYQGPELPVSLATVRVRGSTNHRQLKMLESIPPFTNSRPFSMDVTLDSQVPGCSFGRHMPLILPNVTEATALAQTTPSVLIGMNTFCKPGSGEISSGLWSVVTLGTPIFKPARSPGIFNALVTCTVRNHGWIYHYSTHGLSKKKRTKCVSDCRHSSFKDLFVSTFHCITVHNKQTSLPP